MGAGGAGRAGPGVRAATEDYIALLRAVNLGGTNAVSMPKLCDMLSALRFELPRSLLQSGNLVFRAAPGSGGSLEALLEKTAETQLGLRTDFFVRTAREWEDIVEQNPFHDEAARDPPRLLLLVAKGQVAPGAVRALQAAITGREVVSAGRRHVYAVYPDGVGRSRLTTTLIEKHLGTRVTGRNWNTVLKIAAAMG